MTVPQNILDQLNAVQTDKEAVAEATTASDGAADALTAAQQKKQQADADLASKKAHEATDLQSLLQMLQAEYAPDNVTTPPQG